MKSYQPRPKPAKERLFSGSILDEEIKLETRAIEDGIERYRRNVQRSYEKGRAADLPPVEHLLSHWFEMFASLIEDATEAYTCGEKRDDLHVVGPVLARCDPQEVAYMVMHEAIGMVLAEPAGERLSRVCNSVGRTVLADLTRKHMLKNDAELYAELERMPGPTSAARINWFAKKKNKRVDFGESFEKVRCRLGAFLMKLFIEEAAMMGEWELTQGLRPAFEVSRVQKSDCWEVTLYLSNEAMSVIDDGHAARSVASPMYMPMIVKPYRITKESQNQYVTLAPPLYSNPSSIQRKALANADLTRYWDCLSDITSQGWRLNMDILNVQQQVMKIGGGVAGLPFADGKVYPDEPDGYDNELRGKHGVWDAVSQEDRDEYQEACRLVSKENRTRRADRFAYERKINVAEHFRHWPAFYFPHQCDFRGRTYALPLYLNHQADDTARGLLEFAEGRPPGDEGRRELFIEAANCYGRDKDSFDERVEWADAHHGEIARCARSPLDSIDFWQKADKPWQFLAACMAIHDPEHGAHAPVRPDGTANGVQHYAAISLDPDLAGLVNLAPSDRPSDLYARVADLVLPSVVADAGSNQEVVKYRAYQVGGSHIEKFTTVGDIARRILHLVNRKTCKTPAMTDTYGVTLVGASKQILRAFEDAGFNDEIKYVASYCLAKKVLAGIADACPAAKKVMGYLHYCAENIARAGHMVRWVTKLSFPVVQDYHDRKRINVPTVMGGFDLFVDNEEPLPRVQKHANSCAPNYIHSNDSTHMLMTGSACRGEDIAFAPNHDAYWTHAATKRRMIWHTKDQFINRYTLDPMKELAAYWRAEYPGVDIPDPPARGNFDLNRLRDAEYFFS